MEKAREMQLSHAIELNYLDITDKGLLKKHHSSRIALTIGLFDYFPDSASPDFLRLIVTSLEEGGKLITSNIKPHDVGNHSIMGSLNWYLHERTEEEYKRIIKNPEFNDIDINAEPEDIFMIGVSEKP